MAIGPCLKTDRFETSPARFFQPLSEVRFCLKIKSQNYSLKIEGNIDFEIATASKLRNHDGQIKTVDSERTSNRYTMLIGYARVSTQAQDLQGQLRELKKAGCERIFEDTASGKKDDRPGLTKALDMLRAGDTLIVWKLDRLGRDIFHLIHLCRSLGEKGIQFKSITDGIDTGTPAGQMYFHILAAMANFERALIVERTQVGLETARLKGIKVGRKQLMTPAKAKTAKTLLDAGHSINEAAEAIGVSRPTLYRWLKSQKGD